MRKIALALMATTLAATPPATLAGGAAAAATLRPLTTLTAPVVLLGDLFDDLDAAGAQVLGPGPAPGGRIVVEAAQLAAIARQFGVDWRPNGGNERAVLERPGRLLPREDVVEALRAALAGVGAPDDGDLDLPGYAAPLVPAEAAVRAEVEQLDYDGASGRFNATLSISGEGMLTLRQRLTGTMHEMAEVPVPVRRLLPGAVIGAGDLQTVRVRVALLRGEVARLAEQAVGMAVRRHVAPGQALALADLTRPTAVAKGAVVMLQLQAPGLSVSVQGRALEAGAVGDRIQVLNPASHAVVEGDVIGIDRVRVALGSVPITRAGQTRPFGGAMRVTGR